MDDPSEVKDVEYYLALVQNPEADEVIKNFLEIYGTMMADPEQELHIQDYRDKQGECLRNLEEMGETKVVMELRGLMKE